MQRAVYVLLGVLLVPTVGLVGDIVTDGKFTSTKLTGAPLQVASADMVVNLNADTVDGLEASDFASASDTYTKAEVDALVAAAAAADSRRWFYLTTALRNGGNAVTSCDEGFHMASIYEILDVSNLRYDTARGLTQDDSGSGPPSNPGWVRTGGGLGHGGTGVGEANCNAWASSSGSVLGTQVALSDNWDQPATRVSPWYAFVSYCDSVAYAWCVED